MSLLKIREIGDPVLRTKARKVDEVTDKTRKLIKGMIKTMKHAEGIGLAAPQVGISQRIIVVRTEEKIYELINPQIISQQGKDVAEEGCLSIPEKRGLVSRAQEITVKGLNRQGEEVTIEAQGLLARIFQHEIDHLEGVLFTDKLMELQQNPELM